MQAMLAIVQTEDADAALERLKALGLPAVVRIAASGGFLRQGNVALWAATPPERVPEVMQALRETCHRRTSYIPALPEIPHQAAAFPLEVEIGGATIFLCEVERYEAF
jgi:uncharacterized protein YaaQ